MSPFVPETWPFSIDALPNKTHLVGGSVRDQLLQRRSDYLDLDLVLPYESIATASALAKQYDAGFVVLDESRQIARVVFDQITIDFAQQQGDRIEDDLKRRDFTINAIAFQPHSQTIIDPLSGQADLDARMLRMVSYQNLADDPLRLMRAYRQAAQLGFTVETNTQIAIGQLSPGLQQISMERVRSELDALLSIPSGSVQLKSIQRHRLLAFCLPRFNGKSIELITAIDDVLEPLLIAYPECAQRLSGWVKPVPIGCYRSWAKAAKLSCLLSPEVAAATEELAQLKYSRSEAKIILKLIQAAPAIKQLCSGSMDQAQQFFLFKLADDAFLAVALLALAHGAKMSVLKPMIDRFLDPEDAIAHAQPLLDGNLLMQQIKVSPGPQIGMMLAAVEQAQAEGKIKTQTDALDWITKHYILDV